MAGLLFLFVTKTAGNPNRRISAMSVGTVQEGPLLSGIIRNKFPNDVRRKYA